MFWQILDFFLTIFMQLTSSWTLIELCSSITWVALEQEYLEVYTDKL